MAKTINWPSKGIRAFSSVQSGKSGKSFHLNSILWHDPQHAAAFKAAAEMVIDKHEETRRPSYQHELFFPVTYLYRHCIELKLKKLVRLGVARKVFTRNEVKKELDRHDLMQLWLKVRELLEQTFPGESPDPLSGVENVIKQFHKADPDGQTLRYAHAKNGKRNVPRKLPELIRLSTLRKTMDAVYNFLDTSESMMEDAMDDWDR